MTFAQVLSLTSEKNLGGVKICIDAFSMYLYFEIG